MGQPLADPDLTPRAAAAPLPCARALADCADTARLRALAPDIGAGLTAVCGPDVAPLCVRVDVPCSWSPAGLCRIAARFHAGRVEVAATPAPRCH